METRSQHKRWVWVKIRRDHDIQEFVRLIRAGRFESENQLFRISPEDPLHSIDVEYHYFDHLETIALLRSCPLVEDAGEIPGGVQMKQDDNVAA